MSFLGDVVRKFLGERVGRFFDDLEVVVQKFILIVWGQVMTSEVPGVVGAEKKQRVVEDILAQFEKEGGIELPKWSYSFLRAALPLLIDLIVAEANKRGFFGK